MKKRSCFTLIELLLVISVIAILSGILLPALMKTREIVRQTVCLGNIRQIYLGAACYANDNDGFAYYVAPIPHDPTKQMSLGSYGTNNGSLGIAATNRNANAYVCYYPYGNRLVYPGYIAWKTLQCPAITSNKQVLDAIGIKAWFQQFRILDINSLTPKKLINATKPDTSNTSVIACSSYPIRVVTSLNYVPHAPDVNAQPPIGRLGSKPDYAYATDMLVQNTGITMHNWRSKKSWSYGFNLLFEDGAAAQEQRNSIGCFPQMWWSPAYFGFVFSRGVKFVSDGYGTGTFRPRGGTFTYGYWR